MKKLKKVVGIGVCGYAIANTLFWAYVGVGRYLKDVYASKEIEDVLKQSSFKGTLDYAFSTMDYGVEDANSGWKTWLRRTFGRG